MGGPDHTYNHAVISFSFWRLLLVIFYYSIEDFLGQQNKKKIKLSDYIIEMY